MAFIMKGLSCVADRSYHAQLDMLAARLAAMFGHESRDGWHWYEPYLTYGNSCIPEAMLCAYEVTGKPDYKVIAYKSFEFLLGQVMADDGIHVVTNRGWAHRGKPRNNCRGGEQPIDVAYTIIALDRFYRIDHDDRYREMLVTSFEWFLGRNHIRQHVYNPVTGGCFDGLEEKVVNINQGAESTLSYLMARLIMDRYIQKKKASEIF